MVIYRIRFHESLPTAWGLNFNYAYSEILLSSLSNIRILDHFLVLFFKTRSFWDCAWQFLHPVLQGTQIPCSALKPLPHESRHKLSWRIFPETRVTSRNSNRDYSKMNPLFQEKYRWIHKLFMGPQNKEWVFFSGPNVFFSDCRLDQFRPFDKFWARFRYSRTFFEKFVTFGGQEKKTHSLL